MRIERYSSSLDQILNQHKVDPIDKVYLSRSEFDGSVFHAIDRGIMDHEKWDDSGDHLISFTVKHCAILFVLDK